MPRGTRFPPGRAGGRAYPRVDAHQSADRGGSATPESIVYVFPNHPQRDRFRLGRVNILDDSCSLATGRRRSMMRPARIDLTARGTTAQLSKIVANLHATSLMRLSCPTLQRRPIGLHRAMRHALERSLSPVQSSPRQNAVCSATANYESVDLAGQYNPGVICTQHARHRKNHLLAYGQR